MSNKATWICPIAPDKATALALLSRQTFTEAFAAVNEETYMNAYMDVAYAPEQLSRELGNPHSRFFFACEGDSHAGYLKINFGEAQSDIGDPDAMEVERIYVLAAFQGRGLGQLLMDQAMAEAYAAGVKYVWLGVWEHNLQAQRFYRRNGFEVFGEHPFWLGEDKQTDLLMRRDV